MRPLHYLLFPALFHLASGAAAQDAGVFSDTAAGRYAAGTLFSYDIVSNAVTSGFISAFYNGEFIDSTLKDKVAGKLAGNNRLGGGYGLNVFFSGGDSLFGRAGLGWYAAAESRVVASAGFSEDLFRTVFYGNKSYAGQTANLAPFRLNYFDYQSFRLGITRTGASGFLFGLALVKGRSHISARSERADMYTGPDGERIDFDVQLAWRESDTAAPAFLTVGGVGTAADFAWWRRTANGNLWLAEAHDLGFIRWVGGNAGTFDADTLYQWEGWEVGDIFDLKDSVFDGASSADSVIDGLLPSKVREAYIAWLPARFHLAYTAKAGGQLSIRTGLRYTADVNYLPLAYAQAIYLIDESFSGAIRLAWGGYGGVQAGLEFRLSSKNGYRFLVGTDSFAGHLFPKSATAQGVYVGVWRRW